MTSSELTENLQFLIQCLKKEMPQYLEYSAPNSESETFNLYRALCNVRSPKINSKTMHTLPNEFYKIQSKVLKEITNKKGITNAAELPESKLNAHFSLWQGDITTLKADAIVNAANSQLLGCFSPLHECIDNIIHTMAGVELREKCYEIMQQQGSEERTGSAKITPAYNLPSKYVIHTVGPIVYGPLTEREKTQLASCYNSILNLASENNLKSVAFCCISTGVFRFPKDKAAQIAVKTSLNWLKNNPNTTINKIIFNVFGNTDKQIYEELLNKINI